MTNNSFINQVMGLCILSALPLGNAAIATPQACTYNSNEIVDGALCDTTTVDNPFCHVHNLAPVRNTDRIGSATLNTNQNIAGALARLGLGEGQRFVLWTALCFAVLALTVWAARRALRAEQPVLALLSVAMFGLAVTPVSWSHH